MKAINESKNIIFLFFIILIITACDGTSDQEKEPVVEGTTFVMDTVVNVKLFSGGSNTVLEVMFDKLDEIDQLMSLEYETSDVSQININAGIKPVIISDYTKHVIEESIKFSELSEGYFDISFGPLISLWSINSEQTKIPSKDEIDYALSLASYASIMINENEVELNDENMSIDLGGIAKGYAADIIADIAVDSGVTSGIINIGGNILVIGAKVDEKKSTFSIGIQNPFAIRNGYLGIVNVEDSTIVTSGNYERYFELDGVRYHHILDKDTGYPVNNGIAAVSIVTKNSLDADALSTIVYILGLTKGMELIESLEGSECLFVNNEHEIFLSSGMKDLFVLTDKKFNIIEMKGAQ